MSSERTGLPEGLDPASTPVFPVSIDKRRPEDDLFAGPHGAALRAAVDGLEMAFANARLSDDFSGCPHCFMPSDIEYLRTTPPERLSLSDVYYVGTKLISTLGSADDVAYFTPRLVEALAQGLPIDLDPIIDRIAAIPEPLWTAERRGAVRDAFGALFAAVAVSESHYFSPEEIDRARRTFGIDTPTSAACRRNA